MTNIESMAAESPCPALDRVVRRQVVAASAAQRDWAALELSARLQIVKTFRSLLVQEAKWIARTLDSSARPGEFVFSQLIPMADAARFLERSAGKILKTRRIKSIGAGLLHRGVRHTVSRRPLGTVLIVAPGNYPLFLPGVQVLQALVAGNSVLVKPAPGGAPAAVVLRELMLRAGLDENVLQVLPEATESVNAAVAAGVDKVLFTGSAEAGEQVAAIAARHLTPTILELSGCDPMLVLADADLDLAARAVAFGLRMNDGATCIAPRRIIVHRTVVEQFEALVHRHVSPNVRTAPRAEVDRSICAHIERALVAGGTAVAGGIDAGQMRLPAVISLPDSAAGLANADLFGPVSWLLTVDDDLAAVAMARRCEFALGASVFSRDAARATRIGAKLSAGVVTINDLIAPTADPRIPFGGHRRSGYGSTRGPEGLLELTRPVVMSTRSGARRLHFNPPTSGDDEVALRLLEMTHAPRLATRVASAVRLIRSALTFF